MTSEVAAPTPECPNPQLWHCHDGMATEVEVLDFLFALVRMLKPRIIIETGTYLGHGATQLARAADLNAADGISGAWVHTAEPDPELLLRAAEMLREHHVENLVTLHNQTGVEMIESIPVIDFAFLDSNLETRILEMHALYPRMSKSCVVAVHDTSTFHDKHDGPRTPMLEFAKSHHMQIINFDTPRGLCLLRRQ